jgi:hypothetical protein
MMGRMNYDSDITKVSGIAAVPTILDVVSRVTGMGFTAVARVTETDGSPALREMN